MYNHKKPNTPNNNKADKAVHKGAKNPVKQPSWNQTSMIALIIIISIMTLLLINI